MAEQLLDQVRDIAEGQIVCISHSISDDRPITRLTVYIKDFEGQKLAELLSTALLCIVGAVSFVVGYILQDIKLAVYIALGGTALTFLAVVPPWPFFNQNPVKWLPIGGGQTFTAPQNLVIDEKSIR